jgi:hypothetical protein
VSTCGARMLVASMASSVASSTSSVGGLLLTQTEHALWPLDAALEGALATLRSHAS